MLSTFRFLSGFSLGTLNLGIALWVMLRSGLPIPVVMSLLLIVLYPHSFILVALVLLRSTDWGRDTAGVALASLAFSVLPMIIGALIAASIM